MKCTKSVVAPARHTEHLNERKRERIFAAFNRSRLRESYLRIYRTHNDLHTRERRRMDFLACLSVKPSRFRPIEPEILFDPLSRCVISATIIRFQFQAPRVLSLDRRDAYVPEKERSSSEPFSRIIPNPVRFARAVFPIDNKPIAGRQTRSR